MIIRESVKMLRRVAPQTRTFLLRSKPSLARVTDPLIDVKTVHEMLQKGDQNLKLIDSAWYMPNDERKGIEEFKKETIPGYFLIGGRAVLPNTISIEQPSSTLIR